MMSNVRVLWLLNDSELRKSDVGELNALGVTEIFTPKSFPVTEENLSDDVDFSLDTMLTITPSDLTLLNDQNWYESPNPDVWNIVNLNFEIAFTDGSGPQLSALLKSFKGAIVLRATEHSDGKFYSATIRESIGESGVAKLKALGRRFWFGELFEHQKNYESGYLVRRACFLPRAYSRIASAPDYSRTVQKVLLAIPDLGNSEFAQKTHKKLLNVIKGIPYSIVGHQPVFFDEPNIIGGTPEVVESCLAEYQVMFSYSAEYICIADMPLRAMQVGMPVIFMAGGILDTLGGGKLRGRCTSEGEARKKIQKILNGNTRFIAEVVADQDTLLQMFSAVIVQEQWKNSWIRIQTELATLREQTAVRTVKPKRIAIIVPVKYRGGSLRGTKLLAEALYIGSRESGEAAEIIIFHLDDKETYTPDAFDDVDVNIKQRAYTWRKLDADEARRAMRYSGQEDWEPRSSIYQTPDDGVRQLIDCDLWIVISDRLEAPLLPVKPIIYMIYDYLQRYEPILKHGADSVFIDAARTAKKILVTTDFTMRDALQYAGLEQDKVSRVPMLVPEFWKQTVPKTGSLAPYFVWTTNANQHKNHENALNALRIYYDELDGVLPCFITGVGTGNLLSSSMPHLKQAIDLVKRNKVLRTNVKWLGELPDSQYIKVLANASFLWHAGKIDNGTFSVIEAASVGVPSLSSDYPAMHEINQQFSLSLTWMDSRNSTNMAKQLKYMEENHLRIAKLLPTSEKMAENDLTRFAGKYWEEVRTCL